MRWRGGEGWGQMEKRQRGEGIIEGKGEEREKTKKETQRKRTL